MISTILYMAIKVKHITTVNVLAMMIVLTVTVGILVVKSRGKKGECHFGIIKNITLYNCKLHTAHTNLEEPSYSAVNIVQTKNEAYGSLPVQQEITVEENPAYGTTGQNRIRNAQNC